jgi:anaerobic magnesium-protoporphyrin IX monomethyl ester cyclase
MKILLINPSWSSGYYAKAGFGFPPLGLGYISASLKRDGYNVGIIDMNIEKFDYIHYDFSEWDLVGITSDTVRFGDACSISKIIKQKGVPVVLGGSHASAVPESILKDNLADYVISGEGEESMIELARYLKEPERFSSINNLAYIDKHGQIKINQQTFIKDLDILPFPDRESLKMHRYKLTFEGRLVAAMITSRGCPFNCEFCSCSQFMGMKWRRHSAERSIEEMKILKKSGYDSIIFFDDNFTMDPRRVIELSEGMIKNNFKFKWWAFSRTEEILRHQDMVESMSASGCKMLFVGFESADDSILKDYNKKLTSNKAFEVAKVLKKYKINLYAAFIIGSLSETKKTIKKSVQFAQKLNPKIVQFSILTPYPGTRLFETLKNKIITNDWHFFDGTHLVFKHPNFSPKSLRGEFLKAYIALYKNPKRFMYISKGLYEVVKNSIRSIGMEKYYKKVVSH